MALHEPDSRTTLRPADTGGRLTLFSYTVESLAPLYRAVMRLFLDAKGRYRIQLRPDEVAAELRRVGVLEGLPEGSVDRALDQLVEWGNLRRGHDTGRVTTLEDFRRRHFVYQLTAAGETAERAVGEVLAALERSGSLQRVMLGTILRNLLEIRSELESAAPRPERLFELLFNVTEQFRTLTENASLFLARLHEAIEQGEVRTEAFLLYKQAVLEYLEQFLGELSEISPRITREIQGIEAAGSGRLVALAAQADAAPAPLGIQDPGEGLRRKWQGIAAWFVGDAREPATVEHLRAAARGAINRILLVLERLHEKRFRRVSRAADLLRLAGGFDRLDGEPEGGERAHRLFQALFGLFGAAALARFAGQGPLPLGGLPPLAPDEFVLLLAFLDQLLAVPPAPDGRREARSRDGLLRLVLDPAPPGAASAVIETRAGRLTLPAFTLTVEERGLRAFAAGGAA